MNPLGSLPIVAAVERVLNIYNEYNPDPAEFTLTTNSASLKTVDVLLALLRHAIAPSSVASEVWKLLRVYFNDFIEQHGDPTNPPSLTLRPRDGEWTTVDAGLLQMSETTSNELTEEMSTCARDWMIKLLLPIRSRGKTPGTINSASQNLHHRRVARFREQILEREGSICPVTLLKDEARFGPGRESVTLEAAHILPFSLGNSENLVWKYIEMFTGDTKIQNILQDINVVENGILLQHDVHAAFGNLKWGIETKMENGNYRYFIKSFRDVFFYRPEVGTGTELHFSSESGHNPPHPDLCALHFAVCAVASACGAANVFDALFEHDPDPDVVSPVAGQYTLPTDPTLDSPVIPCSERRLFEESIYVSPL